MRVLVGAVWVSSLLNLPGAEAKNNPFSLNFLKRFFERKHDAKKLKLNCQVEDTKKQDCGHPGTQQADCEKAGYTRRNKNY